MPDDTPVEVELAGRIINGEYDPGYPIERLQLHPANPRRGDVDTIAQSIKVNGFYGTLTAQRSTGRVIVGNHRMQAARVAGLEVVPVIWVDVDDDEALRILVADNESSDKATNDAAQLLDVLSHLNQTPLGLAGSGFTPDDLDKMLKGQAGQDPNRKNPDEELLTLPYTPRTVKGDLWHLGAHRVLCGSSMDAGDMMTLLDGNLVDLLFTSPPYNVDVEYASHDDGTRPWPLYREFLEQVIATSIAGVRPGGAVCWNIGTIPKTFPGRQMVLLEELGLTYLRTMVWEKVGVPVPNWYHTMQAAVARSFTPNYKHELVLIYRAGDVDHESGTVVDADKVDVDKALAVFTRRPFDPTPAHDLVLVYANGDELERGGPVTVLDDLQHDVFTISQAAATIDIPTVSANPRTGARSNLDRRSRKAHPAPFPVALPEAFIAQLADVGGGVLDPFMGAGATLLAAARQGRVAYGMELEPSYVDIICWRYQRLTGDMPVHAATGRVVDFTQPLNAPGGI